MDKLTKDISDIINAEISDINEKVKGLNFLELLKSKLIEKILPLINLQKFPLDKEVKIENEISEKLNNVCFSISYLTNSLTSSKKNIKFDTLFIVFNESANLDIFSDEKNFTSLLLYKNTGISLSKNTIINSKFNKNVLLVKITNKEVDETLKTEKKI